MTRSRQLVSLFHKTCHTICYKDVLRVDVSLAKETLRSMNYENDAVIPPNLEYGKFVLFCVDNIDINDATSDGKIYSMGHKWLHGNGDLPEDDLKPSTRQYVLHVPRDSHSK